MKDFSLFRCLLVIFLLLASSSWISAQKVDSNVYDFGKIEMEAPMEHTFQFTNETSELLQVKNVQLTPPLVVTRMSSRVAPGDKGFVTIRLQQPREKGEFEGSIVVNFKDEQVQPRLFSAVGQLIAAIEFDPFAAFYVSTQRGEEKTASIEISNHEAEAFDIVNVLYTGWRFTTEVETLEPGRRFRLTLRMKAEAPAGRATDEITLVTSSRDHPFLKVQANTNVNERVYAFPGEVDFETINVSLLKARIETPSSFFQSLTVYQNGGTDFQILSVETDVPFLRFTTNQGRLKDRGAIGIEIIPEKLKAGRVNGSIVISTNDAQFPRLVVPVKAFIAGNW
jgi:hypothetical protein